jgi:hypothetical protein
VLVKKRKVKKATLFFSENTLKKNDDKLTKDKDSFTG